MTIVCRLDRFVMSYRGELGRHRKSLDPFSEEVTRIATDHSSTPYIICFLKYLLRCQSVCWCVHAQIVPAQREMDVPEFDKDIH